MIFSSSYMLSATQRIPGSNTVMWVRWISALDLESITLPCFNFRAHPIALRQALCCECFHQFLPKALIMQKEPSVQINWRIGLSENCIYTYQWIELITWASKQPSINTESCKHWNIMRFEHNLFCKHETEGCLLYTCRIYSTTDPRAAQITLLGTDFAQ